nr:MULTISPECIES: nucleotidyl transferase AbiEii/AbiGii toxin family protein [unclassified Bradyrhizobium]
MSNADFRAHRWATAGTAHRRPGTIEVDVNCMYRTPFFGTSLMNSVPLGGYTAKKIPVVDLREIAAGQSVAMAARCALRDLYDAWRLLHVRGLDWKQVNLATLAIGAATRDLNWRTASLDGYSYDANELRGKLLTVVKSDMFDKDGRPEAWRELVLAKWQERLAPLFEHDRGEMSFLDAL